MPKIKYLVFEGGGVKTITYFGALETLVTEKVIDLQEIVAVAGASAGAIYAMLVSLGYSLEEMRKILSELNFKLFGDCDKNIFDNIDRIKKNFGACKGDFAFQWFREIVKNKTGNPDTTFEQLNELRNKGCRQFKNPYLIVCNLSTGITEEASFESAKYRKWSLALAARASMAYPGVFSVVRVKNEVHVDGGTVRNYPIHTFDKRKYSGVSHLTAEPDAYEYNDQTLGFRLGTKHEIEVYKREKSPLSVPINDLSTYVVQLVTLMVNAQNDRFFHEDHQRTLFCDSLDLGSLNFELSDAQKKALLKSGSDEALIYCNKQKLIVTQKQSKSAIDRDKEKSKEISLVEVKIQLEGESIAREKDVVSPHADPSKVVAKGSQEAALVATAAEGELACPRVTPLSSDKQEMQTPTVEGVSETNVDIIRIASAQVVESADVSNILAAVEALALSQTTSGKYEGAQITPPVEPDMAKDLSSSPQSAVPLIFSAPMTLPTLSELVYKDVIAEPDKEIPASWYQSCVML